MPSAGTIFILSKPNIPANSAVQYRLYMVYLHILVYVWVDGDGGWWMSDVN